MTQPVKKRLSRPMEVLPTMVTPFSKRVPRPIRTLGPIMQ